MAEANAVKIVGRSLVGGQASGKVLFSDTPISFMGGVDHATGTVIDTHHPLLGQNVTGKILAIPSGRGSCGGSGVIFEMLLNGMAPAGIVFENKETILTVGVIIAEELFQKSIPLVTVGSENFQRLRNAPTVHIDGKTVETIAFPAPTDDMPLQQYDLDVSQFDLSRKDLEFLHGTHGEAGQASMRIILRAAELQGVKDFIDVQQAHIDGCYYLGPGSLRFAERLRDLGGAVAIPSTLNAISVDKRRWREQGVDASFGVPSSKLADVYEQMGVQPTYTCAPYLLPSAPKFGDQIVWAESNAVIFANSVLGARTMKYPDYLDICIALTGRAPNTDCHLKEFRRAAIAVDLPDLGPLDDSFYPVLGYLLGSTVGSEIPVVRGLEMKVPTLDNLKAMSAAFGTTSASPMFHVLGVTPEAATIEDAAGPGGTTRTISLTREQLLEIWDELNSADTEVVDMISLGNPHFSITECHSLAAVCLGKTKHPDVSVIVTCGRDVYRQAREDGTLSQLEDFGVEFINDTCWCLITQPIVPLNKRASMTNSAKYAHYGPAMINRGVRFASLESCIETACSGIAKFSPPGWLNMPRQEL